MKRIIKFALWLVLLIAIATPATALAKSLSDDRVVAGGTFTLREGETLNGNLIIFGGAVTLEEGSRVNGEVVLMGGTVEIDGNVHGSVVGMGGVVSLGSMAVVDGDLTTLAATLNQEAGAQVRGQIVRGLRTPLRFPFPGRGIVPDVPDFGVRFPGVLNIMWFFFRTFLWAALAVLLVMFLPTHTERVAITIVRQPILAGGVGLLTAVVAPLLLIGIAITIILIPVSLVGILILTIAWFFGRIALGYEIGKRFAETTSQDWPPAVAAGIGTLVMTFVVDGANILIPCVGWIIPALVGIIGLGGILLSRFGTQTYPPYRGSAPVTPPPPAPSEPRPGSLENPGVLPPEE